VPMRAAGIASDLTRRVAQMTELQTAKANLEHSLRKRNAVLAHRQLLLREVYHRMHDTLQVIDGLFAAQAKQLGDRQTLLALSVQRNRIYALGFVHSELMTTVDAETFDIAPFLHELCGAFLANEGHRGVSLRVDADHLQVTLDYTIPFGLLVTELLTNCLAYAPSRAGGRITVSLHRGANAEITLIVSDGNIGPTDAARGASFATGLETRLIKDLTSQLGAEVQVRSHDGLQVEVSISPRHL
jgi:two-component sensor histidine kinase